MRKDDTNLFGYFLVAFLLLSPDFSWARDNDEAVGFVPPDAARIETLARECGIEIAWRFDLRQAIADKQSKPLLVYVRCVNDRRAFDSARRSIAAGDIPMHDDGYRKDLLFRACVLADRNIQSLLTEAFVPVCMTYHFETHGRGKKNADWAFAGKSNGDGFTIDATVGDAAKGSLRLSQTGSLLQPLVRPAMNKGRYRLTASIKTQDLNGRAFVKLLWLEQRGSKQQMENSTTVNSPEKWTRTSFEFELSTSPINILVMPTLFGSGTAWFDDIELREVRDGKSVGPNLLRNGDVDPENGGGDPLTQLNEQATATITPALLVVQNGKIVRKLHRIGAMSPDYVEQWLRSNLKQNKSQLTQPPNDRLQAAQMLIRIGSWDDALKALTALRKNEGSPEGQFWEGLCLHRLGRYKEAQMRWTRAVGPTRWGRRAAACLLPRGPHPVLSLSEHSWTTPGASPSTENPGAFEGSRALQILLEMQHEDGSFGSHNSHVSGTDIYDHWQAAFTGIALQAIIAWKDVNSAKTAKAEAAVTRGREFLVNWSKQPARGNLGAFNYPYAINALLKLGDTDAAQRLTDRIVSEQAADGNWSVYGPQRPTSFNTAQNILALVAARNAGLTVPQTAIDRGCTALGKMRSAVDLFPYAPVIGHEWMTTEFGSIARDPLCEHALLSANKGDIQKLHSALTRFLQFQKQLREPTKHYSSDFNRRGHGSYFLLFALHNAIEAAAHVTDAKLRARCISEIRSAMVLAAEKDSSAIDHAMYGRAYGTAMAMLILAPRP